MEAPGEDDWFYHRAHATVIQSRLRLPDYVPTSERVATPLRIEVTALTEPFPSEYGSAHHEGGYRLWWNTTGDFYVSAEGNILAKRLPGASEALFRLPLLGTVLATALTSHRRFLLHGNAVIMNGRAVVFAGHKGQGKSTLTAYLLRRGHQLLADDITALTLETSGIMAHRGALHLRLWPDSIEHIFAVPAERFEPLFEGFAKHVVPAQQFACKAESVPLAGIISLCESDMISLERLSLPAAWKEVVIHSFHSRLGSGFLTGDRARWHHEQCAKIVRGSRLYRFHRPRTFDRLEEAARCLEDAFA